MEQSFWITVTAVLGAIVAYSWGRSDGEYKTFRYFMDWMEENDE